MSVLLCSEMMREKEEEEERCPAFSSDWHVPHEGRNYRALQAIPGPPGCKKDCCGGCRLMDRDKPYPQLTFAYETSQRA